MPLALTTPRQNQAVQFGVTFNTHCEDNLKNIRLLYTAQINQARKAAQKDGTIASIDDTKDPFRVSFRVGQNYAAADIQTRHNGFHCLLTEKGESAKQFVDRVIHLLKSGAPKLKSGKEHTAEIPDLATQLLSNFVKAAQEGSIESSPIAHQDSEWWDSKEYNLKHDNQFYHVIVHREKDGRQLTIHFNKNHHDKLYLESKRGVVQRFECELSGKPTLQIHGNDEHFDSDQPKPNPIAIAKLQQNLVSLVEALEGKKPLQEAIQ